MPVVTQYLIKISNDNFLKAKFDFLLRYVADDIRWNIVGSSVIIGKINFLEAMRTQELETFPEIKIKNIIAEGNYVVVESTGNGKTRSGKNFNPAYCDIYRLENGKIKELTTYIVKRKK